MGCISMKFEKDCPWFGHRGTTNRKTKTQKSALSDSTPHDAVPKVYGPCCCRNILKATVFAPDYAITFLEGQTIARDNTFPNTPVRATKRTWNYCRGENTSMHVERPLSEYPFLRTPGLPPLTKKARRML